MANDVKTFDEEFTRLKIEDLQPFQNELKGEITIVISEKKVDKKILQILSESDKRNIEKMINKLSTKEIADLISQKSGVSKKEVYNYCIKLKDEK